MSQDKQNNIKGIIKNISTSFITGSVLDTAVYVALNAPKYNFRITDKQFAQSFQRNFKDILRNNAVSASTYYISIACLQKTLNKENQFNKRLYIRMGSAVLSTLAVEVGFYREKGYWILGSAALAASTEFFVTIYSDWAEGGKDYVSTNFPKIYNTVSNSSIVQKIQNAQVNQQ